MSLGLYLGYLGTVVVLALSPGPSTLLASAQSMQYGPRGTLPTVAGDLSANTLQMLGAGLGLGAVITNSQTAFTLIKWAGVLYLAWMGIQRIRSRADRIDVRQAQSGRTPAGRYLQGFLSSASNPKAVVFFGALFPQFIDPNVGLISQLMVLGITFLVIDGFCLMLYATTADRLSIWLTAGDRLRTQRWITGSVLLGAAGLLALKGAPSSAS